MSNKYFLKRDEADDRDFKFSDLDILKEPLRVPSSFDLRSRCPAVYDQGDLGSCTANAGCACRSMLEGKPDLLLSRMFLYYEERKLEGNIKEDSGASLRDTCKSMHKLGVCEEKYHPYLEENLTLRPSREAVYNARNYRINAYRSIKSLEEIKQCLLLKQQPVLIGMDVYESMESDKAASTGYLPMPKKGENKLGGHAVLVVGYKEIRISKFPRRRRGFLIVRNSWGENWGDKGYFYMPYEFVRRGFAFDFWTIE